MNGGRIIEGRLALANVVRACSNLRTTIVVEGQVKDAVFLLSFARKAGSAARTQ